MKAIILFVTVIITVTAVLSSPLPKARKDKERVVVEKMSEKRLQFPVEIVPWGSTGNLGEELNEQENEVLEAVQKADPDPQENEVDTGSPEGTDDSSLVMEVIVVEAEEEDEADDKKSPKDDVALIDFISGLANLVMILGLSQFGAE